MLSVDLYFSRHVLVCKVHTSHALKWHVFWTRALDSPGGDMNIWRASPPYGETTSAMVYSVCWWPKDWAAHIPSCRKQWSEAHEFDTSPSHIVFKLHRLVHEEGIRGVVWLHSGPVERASEPCSAGLGSPPSVLAHEASKLNVWCLVRG